LSLGIVRVHPEDPIALSWREGIKRRGFEGEGKMPFLDEHELTSGSLANLGFSEPEMCKHLHILGVIRYPLHPFSSFFR
jgi:hypothetical protein